MLKVIKNPGEIGRDKWAEYVIAHPHGNIFHSPVMFDLYNPDSKHQAVLVSVLDSDGNISGLLVAYIHREYTGYAGIFTSRAIVWGGPLVSDENQEITAFLLKEFIQICKGKAIYSQFRNLWDTTPFKGIFAKENYTSEEHLNFIFHLEKGEEELWKNVHPTRRKQINRGMKRGVRTEVQGNLTGNKLKACYDILKNVYGTAKLPVPDISFFEKAFRILGSDGSLRSILAFYENNIIGFRLFLCYKDILYDWYAGSHPGHLDKYPNDILPWELIKWGSSNGYKTFDFGGAGKPGVKYGVRDYKQKFGGTLVNYGRYEKVHKPLLMLLGKAGFKIWKIIKH